MLLNLTSSRKKGMKLTISRICHHLYALTMGYFWTSCPICGQSFGGHETTGMGYLMTSWTDGESVCPRCTGEARRRNEKFMAQNPHPGYWMEHNTEVKR